LEMKLVRENPGLIKEDLNRRGDLEKVPWVDRLLDLDSQWRESITRINKLRERRNQLTALISKLKKEGKDPAKEIGEAEGIPSKIRELEEREGRLREEIDSILYNLPNLMHESVPIGKDEGDNVELRRWGKIPEFGFEPKDHIDLSLGLGLIDLERAARAAGARFYYLKGDLVRLNQALISFALDFIKGKGFTLIQPPYMLKREAIKGAVALSDFEDVIYKVEGEDLHLIPTSEHALLALHMGEVLSGEELPLKYGGVSPCFRKEAGAHGRDTKGIFRVHQFEKVEQFIFCKPEESWHWHEKLIENAEGIFQALGIPYRVVNICSGELGTVAAKKYDLEVWLPGQGKYREAVSCSNCTSYQAVRSNIRYREKPHEPAKYVHTLNSTLLATERALIAILENYQKPDGSIGIPEALRRYMGGQSEIRGN
jgi:seryl-tRNA synthetase